MATRMQQRRGTAAQWTSANPTLGAGEIGFETDTNKFKIGNGETAWTGLSYFANVSQIIDGAPDLLNTLNEIAAAIGDDANFATTISTSLNGKQDKVTGVSDTEIGYLDGVTSAIQAQLDNKQAIVSGVSNTEIGYLDGVTSGIQEQLNSKAATTYVDQEISDLATTAQGYADTAESNAEAYVNAVIGDVTVTGIAGNTVTARIAEAISELVSSSPETLDALNELAAALGNDPDFATTVSTEIGTKVSKSGDTMTGLLTLSADPTTSFHASTKGYVDSEIASLSSTLETADGEILSSINTVADDLDTLSGQVQTLSDNVDEDITNLGAQIQTVSDDLSGDITNLSTQVGSIATDVETLQSDLGDLTSDVQDKAPINSPSFTGTVVLPTTTSVGDVSSSEIGHLNGVTSSIQNQIDDKLDSGVAAITYATINNPTFGGTVSLPSTTSIGDVSNTEISYLNGVSSSVQTQINDLDTLKAPKESPTFTGTVSGVTKSHVGLGNVDNTSDADKPISTDTQAALDAKASLSGANFTGNVDVDGNLVVDGDFTVNGTNFAASATSITIEDNMLQLAHQNAANTVDLGLVVGYNDGATKHSGIVRDVSDDRWKLFKGVTTEPATTVAFGEGSLDDLQVNNLTASGVVFTDGTQTKAGVPSLTTFVEKTSNYTLDTLAHQDNIVEMNSSSAITFTIPTNTALAWPIGASMDIIATGTGEVTIIGDTGVTVNRTPGNKLRTQWSSATILKRGTNNWILYGDLKA
jgi:hypothetical protein